MRRERWDRSGWITVIVLSVAGIAYLLSGMIPRVIWILGNRDVPVAVPLQNRSADIAIGDTTTPVTITQGLLHVGDLHGLTFVSVLLGELLRSGAPIALLALLAVFCFRMSRERVFDRTNSRLVTWAGVTVLLGWAVGGFFAHMGVNGAVSAVGGPTAGAEVGSTVDLFPIAIGLVVMLLGVVFEVGARMKRETEGLV